MKLFIDMFVVFAMMSIMAVIYFVYKIHVFADKTNLILEELYLLLRDGNGEDFFNSEGVESYSTMKNRRDGELDARKSKFEEELRYDAEKEISYFDGDYVPSHLRSTITTDPLEIQKIFNDDSETYATGIYDLDHTKIDASISDVDEFAK